MKVVIKNKFKEMKEKKGTTQISPSMTDASQAEETNIYVCLQKYGINSMINQTKAKEFLYLDNTNRNMTLDEAVRAKQQVDEYFAQQPARVRKVFGDSADIFYEKYKNKDFGDFLSTGVLSDEIVAELTKPEIQDNKKETTITPDLNTQVETKGEINV